MFRLNLKIALRNLWKYKGYTFINIAGLAIGIASCILIFVFLRYQLSFDKDYANPDRIFRIVSNWKYVSGVGASEGVPIPLAGAARNEFPQLQYIAAVQTSRGVVTINDGQNKISYKEETKVQYVEPQFFDIFDFKWLTDKPDLKAPNTVAISEKNARKYFGDWHKALGKTIKFRNNIELNITGVFKDAPENSSLPINIAISYATYPSRNGKDWGSVASSSECYILLNKDVKIADLDAPMQAFNKKYYPQKDNIGQQYHSFQALSDIHYDGNYGNIAGKITSKNEMYGLSVIGFFLIITACINFINLATAQAVSRSKEVGVRKVMGGMRKQLVVQFLTETLAITFIATLLACILAEMALPGMQNLFDEKMILKLSDYNSIFIFMLCLMVLVSFLAGFYPALVISGFDPVLALKNKVTSNAKGLNLRKVLVVVQFTITIVLIIGTLFIRSQMDYLRKKPLGFNQHAIAIINVPQDSLSRLKYSTFKDRILQIGGVEQVSFCEDAPSSNAIRETNFSYRGEGIKDFQARITKADENYFKLFGLGIVAGKSFSKSDTLSGYVVNETLLKMINVNPQQALGQMLSQNRLKAPIIGVVKDFNDKSLHEKISPLIIYSDKESYYNLAVKMNEKELMNVTKEVEKLWNTTFPEQVYDGKFVDDSIKEYYESERITGTLFRVFSTIIIFISLTGLFGLISFVATQRTREVAIRKVLGASTFELVKLLNGSFLLMVCIANLIAWPLAYIFVSGWLSSFAYRIEISFWPFLIAMISSVAITLITVSLRSYKAASINAIDALKYE